MEKLWTVLEVVRCLGLDEAEVERLVQDGTLTGYRLGGQYLRFRPDQVKALKGKVAAARGPVSLGTVAREPWSWRLREFLYFYDFYLMSAVLLAALVVYLLAVG